AGTPVSCPARCLLPSSVNPHDGSRYPKRVSSIRRVHPAWIVLGAVTICMLTASGIRSVFGVYIKPMEAEFGWGRGALSGAAAISLLLLGAAGPVVGRLADRWGPRWIVIVALLLRGVGSIGSAYLQKLWHVYFTRDDPAERGVRPYGATGTAMAAAQSAAVEKSQRVRIQEEMYVPQFWLLMATFFVCGYTSNGMVLTHFMPHALEHNFSELQASTALGVMGAMNVLGTVGSGWICDRFGRRGPLAFYYFVRGLSLLFLLYVWNAPSLHLWAAIFGLNYISTVPPTTTLIANIFGRYSVGELSGWIFFSHQVGAALGAAIAGWIYEWTGVYTIAFVSAALMGFLAAALALAIREEPITLRPMGSPAPATS